MSHRRPPSRGRESTLEGTVRNLQELYTVTMGVALVKAVERMTEGHTVDWLAVPDFFAFLVTIIPFYHGAMRHLDVRYIEQAGTRVRRGTLLGDFLLLFVEACLLLGAAFMIGRPSGLGWAICSLLILDSAWSLMVYRFATVGARHLVELKWLSINLIATPLLAATLLAWPRLVGAGHLSEQGQFSGLSIALAGLAMIRSIADYWVSWDFYFPWPSERD